ncbi:hypothetical protein HRE53_27370 (plasmid) [Acaryochloris sp. 'Moss Beach']|uniref:hypothetical protein n=1 Tax=Acaryochloris TaxID=155977 RepID=UPI001BAE72F9|nr:MULTISPECIES: hypothetical protein [Acaryochloris]QUY45739.1 hypothetical protein I1H34_28705 [Acaryochloris marina S15]UJB72318.1 hypothetical protein HRE53_27370 [Acaryochloris sp. 'Moss Beach']
MSSSDDQDFREMLGASKELTQAILSRAIQSNFLRPPNVTATFKQAVQVAKEGQQRGFSPKELSGAIKQTGFLDAVEAQGGDVKKAESLVARKAQISNAVDQFPSSPQRDPSIDRQQER